MCSFLTIVNYQKEAYMSYICLKRQILLLTNNYRKVLQTKIDERM